MYVLLSSLGRHLCRQPSQMQTVSQLTTLSILVYCLATYIRTYNSVTQSAVTFNPER